ncbi:uncharacterized protein PG986_004453 [Apiospora aurea]|uniref:Uncharacterized protein n=1 Tax=Apiospora aurea TaxID=335848 RepID=A0ABR1QMM8_9PEZI
MTFVPDSKLHTTNPYYNGKTKGWRLKGCEAEEYPFGAGNPNRNPNTKIWAQQSVLRLIPQDENGDHGRAMKAFYRAAGNGNSRHADGLIFSISFTGRAMSNPPTEADLYVDPNDPASTAINPCAAGSTLQIGVGQMASQYCEFPSPGRSEYVNGAWQYIGTSNNRKRGNRYYSCDNFAGYNGPAMMRKRRGRRRGLNEMSPAEVRQLAHEKGGNNITVSDGNLEIRDPDVIDDSWISVPENPAQPAPPPLKVSARQLPSGGGLLDPKAYAYLGCDNAEDDPCTYGDGSYCFDVDNTNPDDPDPDEPEEPEEPEEPTCDDKCKLDRGNPCNCNENGCDDYSPACCGNASCPSCDCNESGCSSGSPACCASGTCAWASTGGGGG